MIAHPSTTSNRWLHIVSQSGGAGYNGRVETLGKVLLVVAVVAAALGAAFLLLGRAGVDRLPGDLVFRRDNVTVWVPLGTMLLVSIVLTIVLNVLLRR
jgi:hypothetical protein